MDPTQYDFERLARENGGRLVLLGIVALVLISAAATSFYTVPPDSRAVIKRFGAVAGQAQPGLHFKLPWGIDTVTTVPTKRVLKQEFGFRTVQAGPRSRYEKTPRLKERESLMLTGDLNVIGAFDYALPGTPPGHYHSLFVTRAGAPSDLESHAGGMLAYNEALSHSGWAAAQLAAGAAGFRFTRHLETGSHPASVRAVAAGLADIAAIDAVSWRTIRRAEPAAAALQVIGRTASAPGLALVTRSVHDPAPVARALAGAAAALADATRRTLGIAGFVALGKAGWLSVPTPPGPEADDTPSPLHRAASCALLPGQETAASGARRT